MKIRSYQKIFKKAYTSHSTSLKTNVIVYAILALLLFSGLHLWGKTNIFNIYMYSYMGLLLFSLISEYSIDRGEKIILNMCNYWPYHPSELYFYNYIHKTLLSPIFHLESIGASLFFYLSGISLANIIVFLINIHLFYLSVSFLLCPLGQKKQIYKNKFNCFSDCVVFCISNA
ncbi:hypothetical protein P9738_15155 [Bacillus siamensis]|uniref:hypothetical protein n=1 Tax=Bacillus siamensis TaxID=659243 RepID=UPI002E24496B|nr:hypothetical protein [Bacillus siamensis]MED5097499.1 hypothetical protein [Bacillus siamensis]